MSDVVDGDVEHGSLMAGQSVGMVVDEQPVAQIIATLAREAEDALMAR
jgi:enoyl-[acyl-carrier protein] reductase II